MMKNYTKKVQRSKGSASLHWTGKAILSLVLMILLTAQGFANPKLFQSLEVSS